MDKAETDALIAAALASALLPGVPAPELRKGPQKHAELAAQVFFDCLDALQAARPSRRPAD